MSNNLNDIVIARFAKARREKKQIPEGGFDEHVWQPSDYEHNDCCNSISEKLEGMFNSNSRKRKHCCSAAHIRNLVNKHGIVSVVNHFKLMRYFSHKIKAELRDEGVN